MDLAAGPVGPVGSDGPQVRFGLPVIGQPHQSTLGCGSSSFKSAGSLARAPPRSLPRRRLETLVDEAVGPQGSEGKPGPVGAAGPQVKLPTHTEREQAQADGS